MKLIEMTQVSDELAEMVALFRVELHSYKGIASKPNIESGAWSYRSIWNFGGSAHCTPCFCRAAFVADDTEFMCGRGRFVWAGESGYPVAQRCIRSGYFRGDSVV